MIEVASARTRLRVGVISDIHGNAVALDAVLDDLEEVDHLVCLGDVVEGGPQPVECLERVRALRCPVVMGNTDEWLLDPALEHDDPLRVEQARWTRELIGDDGLAFLRTFEPTVAIGDVLCFHGSPRSSEDLLEPTTPDDEFGQMLGGADAPVMCGGHIHFQWTRRFRGSLFFNPGSVGFVNDYTRAARERGLDPFAEYAVVSLDGERLSLDLRRVPYDVAPVKAACYDSGMPYGDAIARRWL